MENAPCAFDLTLHDCDLIPKLNVPFHRKQFAKRWHISTAVQCEAQISTSSDARGVHYLPDGQQATDYSEGF
jgi:hypothetical protein